MTAEKKIKVKVDREKAKKFINNYLDKVKEYREASEKYIVDVDYNEVDDVRK